jgi:hypothetical protein
MKATIHSHPRLSCNLQRAIIGIMLPLAGWGTGGPSARGNDDGSSASTLAKKELAHRKGRSFQSKVGLGERTNLLFFVTVHIVDPAGSRVSSAAASPRASTDKS